MVYWHILKPMASCKVQKHIWRYQILFYVLDVAPHSFLWRNTARSIRCKLNVQSEWNDTKSRGSLMSWLLIQVMWIVYILVCLTARQNNMSMVYFSTIHAVPANYAYNPADFLTQLFFCPQYKNRFHQAKSSLNMFCSFTVPPFCFYHSFTATITKNKLFWTSEVNERPNGTVWKYCTTKPWFKSATH